MGRTMDERSKCVGEKSRLESLVPTAQVVLYRHKSDPSTLFETPFQGSQRSYMVSLLASDLVLQCSITLHRLSLVVTACETSQNKARLRSPAGLAAAHRSLHTTVLVH